MCKRPLFVDGYFETTPRWNYALSGDYRLLLGNGGTPFVSVSLHGQSNETSELGGSTIGFFTGAGDRNASQLSTCCTACAGWA